MCHWLMSRFVCVRTFQMKGHVYPGGSQLALLSLTLLLPPPPTVTPHPRFEPPSGGFLRLRSASFELSSSSVELPSSSISEAWQAWPGEDPQIQRRARENGGEERGNPSGEALTSILGGLLSVGREKGGFGFRFGRNSRARGRGP
ncbi:uncharacterized protein qrfp [Syngnathus typhle]|uniref:uncharacterized protein qrfp n=1 Tax=Syngnathus typhle TaxID=161592 RepID=UPI002A69CE04|nr:uncharacterized protein qrfp [Syngnathus typhle]